MKGKQTKLSEIFTEYSLQGEEKSEEISRKIFTFPAKQLKYAGGSLQCVTTEILVFEFEQAIWVMKYLNEVLLSGKYEIDPQVLKNFTVKR